MRWSGELLVHQVGWQQGIRTGLPVLNDEVCFAAPFLLINALARCQLGTGRARQYRQVRMAPSSGLGEMFVEQVAATSECPRQPQGFASKETLIPFTAH